MWFKNSCLRIKLTVNKTIWGLSSIDFLKKLNLCFLLVFLIELNTYLTALYIYLRHFSVSNSLIAIFILILKNVSFFFHKQICKVFKYFFLCFRTFSFLEVCLSFTNNVNTFFNLFIFKVF